MKSHLLASSMLTLVAVTAHAQSIPSVQGLQTGSVGGMRYYELGASAGCSASSPCSVVTYLSYMDEETTQTASDVTGYFGPGSGFAAANPHTVVIAPIFGQGQNSTLNWGGYDSVDTAQQDQVVAIVQSVEASMGSSVNTKDSVVTGGSLGGNGTQAALIDYGPKGLVQSGVFAAGLSLDAADYAASSNSTDTAALCGVPLMAVHGTADSNQSVAYDQTLQSSIDGNPACGNSFTFVPLQGQGHGTWAGSSGYSAGVGSGTPLGWLTSEIQSLGGSNSTTVVTNTTTPTSTTTPSPAPTPSSTASQDIQIADDAIKLAEAEMASSDPDQSLIAALLTEARSRLDAEQSTPTPSPVPSPTPAPSPTPSPEPTPTPAPTPTPPTNTPCSNGIGATSSGGFSVANGEIVGPDGKVFIANGIAIGPQDMTNASQILADFPGVNFIRLATWYTAPYSIAQYQAFVSAMSARGVVVEIEDHAYPSPGTYTGSQLAAESAWYASLASAFKANPYVWFGSMNEPNSGTYGASEAAISTQEAATYSAIRNAGNTSMIMMELDGGGNPGTIGAGFGMTPSTYATMTNIAWDLHYYGWASNYSTDPATVTADLMGSASGGYGIAAAQTITSADGTVPVIIGEFGNSTTGDSVDPNGTQVVNAVLNSGYGYAAWDWGGNGGPDQLVQGNSLTAYGQQVATAISQGSNVTTSPCGTTSTTATASTNPSQPTTVASSANTVVPQNSLANIAAPSMLSGSGN